MTALDPHAVLVRVVEKGSSKQFRESNLDGIPATEFHVPNEELHQLAVSGFFEFKSVACKLFEVLVRPMRPFVPTCDQICAEA